MKLNHRRLQGEGTVNVELFEHQCELFKKNDIYVQYWWLLRWRRSKHLVYGNSNDCSRSWRDKVVIFFEQNLWQKVEPHWAAVRVQCLFHKTKQTCVEWLDVVWLPHTADVLFLTPLCIIFKLRHAFQCPTSAELQKYIKYTTHNYVSQFTTKTHCYAEGWFLFKQPWSIIYNWECYGEEWIRKCRSVRLFVRPFVTLLKFPTHPLLLTLCCMIFYFAIYIMALMKNIKSYLV